MVAAEGGAVFDGAGYDLEASRTKLFVHYFLNETVTATAGGALVFENMNDAAINILQDCTFFTNYGGQGGSVYLNNGGILAGINNTFDAYDGFLDRPDAFNDLLHEK